MKQHNRLVRSIQAIDHVLELMKDNYNSSFIEHHLLSVRLELKTQLTNTTNSSKITE